MGKKSKILYYTVLLVNIGCFILDLLPINFPFFRISFAATLILIGLMLVVRAFTLKIDSSMFFGITLFCCGILNLVIYFGQIYWALDINQLWPYYLFSLGLASLVTGLYFKEKIQLKLVLLFVGLGLFALLFVQKLIALWLMIVLMIVWFVGYFTINIILFKRRGR